MATRTWLVESVGTFLLVLASRCWNQVNDAKARRFASWVGVLVTVELTAGFLNIALAAPGWMQLVHLALADAVWIATLLLAVETLKPPPHPAEGS